MMYKEYFPSTVSDVNELSSEEENSSEIDCAMEEGISLTLGEASHFGTS